MTARTIEGSKLTLPRMGFGGAPLGNLFNPVSEDEARTVLAAAWNAGLRYFDTAPLYGHGLSEQRIGAALREHDRDTFQISTKVGRLLEPSTQTHSADGSYVDTLPLQPRYDYSYDGAMRSVEQSLLRLGMDHVDILFIHDIDVMTHGKEQSRRYDDAMKGNYKALEKLRASGAVKAIGLGVNEWEVCAQALQDADFDCFLLAGQYSLLKQDALESFLPACEARNVSVIIGGPFNSGILASGPVPGARYFYKPAPPEILDRTRQLQETCAEHEVPLPAAALQFPLHHKAVASVIPGARSQAELQENLSLLDYPIPSALWDDLKARGLIRKDAPVPLAATTVPGTP